MSTTISDFIYKISSLPDRPSQEDIEEAISPTAHFEHLLRQNLVNTSDPYIGLLDVFDTSTRFRKSRPRRLDRASELDALCLFALSDENWRIAGSSCVADLATFQKNWAVFTHGVLDKFSDWSNIVVAGGSVLAALVQTTAQTDRDLFHLYHSDVYSSADVDLFIWGLSPAEAEKKICDIFEAVKASVPWDVVALRRSNIISIHTQFPYRHVQIILRLYQSPTEIMIGFDVDCCCVAYDGAHVWATPRSMTAIITKMNRVDMTRRSPSYEMRLVKYARRGFEIWYPNLRRRHIAGALYHRDLEVLPPGLARLIVLENLFRDRSHYRFISYPGKSLQARTQEHEAFLVDDDNDDNCDYAPYQIPYDLRWDAKRVRKFSEQVARTLDAFHNDNVDQYLHRHAMIACDDIKDCFSNVCSTCPLPRNIEEIQQQKIYDRQYIRGNLRFMVENPNQQLISGSFNPINNNEWERDAYE